MFLSSASEPELVPAVSSPSHERVEPTIDNTCAVDLELLWVDFEGRERSYGFVEAGAALALDTYRGHVWRARDLRGVEVRAFAAGARASVALCDESHAPSSDAPARAGVPRAEPGVSPRSIQPAFVTIENTCAEVLDVFWVSFDGTERPYGVVNVRQRKLQPTFLGHLWRLRRPDGTLAASFVATGDDRVAPCGGSLAPDAA